jgi:hypothetical protein
MHLAAGLAGANVACAWLLHHLTAAIVLLRGYEASERRHSGPKGHYNQQRQRAKFTHKHSVNPSQLHLQNGPWNSSPP